MGFPKPMQLHGLRIIVDGNLLDYLIFVRMFLSAGLCGTSMFEALEIVVDIFS